MDGSNRHGNTLAPARTLLAPRQTRTRNREPLPEKLLMAMGLNRLIMTLDGMFIATSI